MNTLASRLTHALSARGKSPAQLARAVKKTESAVSQWLSGETKSMRGDSLLAVCTFLSCNPQWLSSGIGPSGLDDSPRDPSALGAVVEISGHSRQKNRPSELVIPQYDTGGGMSNGGLILEDQPGVIKSWHVDDEWLRLNVRSHTGAGNLCIVTGFGPSMRPMFNPGDPLLVDRGVTTVEDDAVYFFRIGKSGFVKLLQKIPDMVGDSYTVRAKSKNPDFDPFDILPDNPHFQVLGKVLTVWKSEQF